MTATTSLECVENLLLDDDDLFCDETLSNLGIPTTKDDAADTVDAAETSSSNYRRFHMEFMQLPAAAIEGSSAADAALLGDGYSTGSSSLDRPPSRTLMSQSRNIGAKSPHMGMFEILRERDRAAAGLPATTPSPTSLIECLTPVPKTLFRRSATCARDDSSPSGGSSILSASSSSVRHITPSTDRTPLDFSLKMDKLSDASLHASNDGAKSNAVRSFDDTMRSGKSGGANIINRAKTRVRVLSSSSLVSRAGSLSPMKRKRGGAPVPSQTDDDSVGSDAFVVFRPSTLSRPSLSPSSVTSISSNSKTMFATRIGSLGLDGKELREELDQPTTPTRGKKFRPVSSSAKNEKEFVDDSTAVLRRVRPRASSESADENRRTRRLVKLRPSTHLTTEQRARSLSASINNGSLRSSTACKDSNTIDSLTDDLTADGLSTPKTVEVVTRPSQSLSRPWHPRKTAFRHCVTHLPYQSTEDSAEPKTTNGIKANNKTSDATGRTSIEGSSAKRRPTALYCSGPKRSTSPFMSLREINERMNSPTMIQTESGGSSGRKRPIPYFFGENDDDGLSCSSPSALHASDDDSLERSPLHKNEHGGSFTVVSLSQSNKLRREMQVIRGTRRCRTQIGGHSVVASPRSRQPTSPH